MNRGSATLKAALYEIGSREELLVSIAVEQDTGSGARLTIADSSGAALFESRVDEEKLDAALELIFSWLDKREFFKGLAAAGHRLVHGGPRYREPQRITPQFLTELEKLVPLDPDHLPEAIRGIQFIARKFPSLPQVACFDTAFHGSLPKVARMYALPRRFYDEGCGATVSTDFPTNTS